VVTLNDLDEQGLLRILQNPNSTVIQGKKRDLKQYGINIHFEPESPATVGGRSVQRNTPGARGLVSVSDRLLLKYKKNCPTRRSPSFTRHRADRAKSAGGTRSIAHQPFH
jgi:ATP-dependent protease Clp ATPase subunit